MFPWRRLLPLTTLDGVIVTRASPPHRVLVFELLLARLAMLLLLFRGMLARPTNFGLASALGWLGLGLTAGRAGVMDTVPAIRKPSASAS